MLSGVVLKLGYRQLLTWYEGSVSVPDMRKGQQADLISLFLVGKMSREVAYFLQIRSAIKFICEYMCTFKGITFK